MADYGQVGEVTAIPQGSFLLSDAAVSDTSLVVVTAAEFDPDGGTLDLNGTQLAYTGIDYGTAADDPDELLLADPLAIGADTDDTVSVVKGTQVAVDYYAAVTMNGDGDNVLVKLLADQVPSWPIGQYDPPVDVTLSDDLLYIVDAPGRTVLSRVEAWNRDYAEASADDVDVEVPTTYKWRPNSMQVKQNGVDLLYTEWTENLSAQTVTVDSSAVTVRDGDRFALYYLYDDAATAILGTVPPSYIDAILDRGPIWFGVQDDASGTILTDYSGFGRNGTYTGPTLGATQIVPNLIASGRTCADYDGAGDESSTGYGSWINTTQVAWVAWINTDTIGTGSPTGKNTIATRNNGVTFASNGLRLTGAGKLEFFVITNTGTYTVVGATTLSTGVDYMVSGIYDGSTVQVFVDGSLDGSTSANGNLVTSLAYGAALGSAGGFELFNGRIGPVAMFDPSLGGFSAADIPDLYAAGVAT